MLSRLVPEWCSSNSFLPTLARRLVSLEVELDPLGEGETLINSCRLNDPPPGVAPGLGSDETGTDAALSGISRGLPESSFDRVRGVVGAGRSRVSSGDGGMIVGGAGIEECLLSLKRGWRLGLSGEDVEANPEPLPVSVAESGTIVIVDPPYPLSLRCNLPLEPRSSLPGNRTRPLMLLLPLRVRTIAVSFASLSFVDVGRTGDGDVAR